MTCKLPGGSWVYTCHDTGADENQKNEKISLFIYEDQKAPVPRPTDSSVEGPKSGVPSCSQLSPQMQARGASAMKSELDSDHCIVNARCQRRNRTWTDTCFVFAVDEDIELRNVDGAVCAVDDCPEESQTNKEEMYGGSLKNFLGEIADGGSFKNFLGEIDPHAEMYQLGYSPSPPPPLPIISSQTSFALQA
jgi:hypothetical protein